MVKFIDKVVDSRFSELGLSSIQVNSVMRVFNEVGFNEDDIDQELDTMVGEHNLGIFNINNYITVNAFQVWCETRFDTVGQGYKIRLKCGKKMQLKALQKEMNYV